MPIKLGKFTGAKRLSKGREPLEKVAQLPIHFQPINETAEVRKKYGVLQAPNGVSVCSNSGVRSTSRAGSRSVSEYVKKFTKRLACPRGDCFDGGSLPKLQPAFPDQSDLPECV